MQTPRAKISAFIIAFNEEHQLASCLESVAFCDEIVVVDSLSTDSTPEIARQHGARVISHPWSGYVGQKAFALSQVSNEWALNVDADERVSPELRAEIEAILSSAPALESRNDIAGYEMNRVVFHLGRWWRRGGWYPEYRLRFFRKSRIRWGGVEPHERPIPDGRVLRLAGELQHFTYDNLGHQFERLHQLSTISAQEEFARGERARIRSIALHPLLRFLKFYVVKRGFREGYAGLIVAAAEGYYTFMKYAKLWELEHFGAERKISGARRHADAPRRSSQNE